MQINSVLSRSHLENKNWLYSGLGTVGALVCGVLIAKLGIVGIGLCIAAPIGIGLVTGILMSPRFGLLVYLQYSFLVNILARFLPVSAPFGLVVDGLLALILLSLLFNGRRLNWANLKNPTFFLVGTWFLYNVMELANPEAPYKPAWFFHVRAFSMHWFFVTIIVLVTPIKRSDILLLLRTWLIWSVFAAIWAFKQQYLGLTQSELEWLNSAGGKTHLLFGHLRSWSYYTDASQFGAEMAGLALICLIFFFEEDKWLVRLSYLGLAFVYFWGYAVSGTRSALFVFIAGYGFYLLLKRDFTKIALGLSVAIPVLLMLLYTDIGNQNYQVYRIRTALKPMEDPSFLVRLENQAKLANYLRYLPFGAGIGTAADAGARFSPGHFAAQIPPDSWYVELWIETGVVGVYLYVAMLLAIVGVGVYRIWHLNDPWLSKIMGMFIAEFVGIAVMGYSNPVLGQFPTSTMLYLTSLAFTTCNRWDTPAKKPA